MRGTLGLAIVKQIVELHGGTIAAESAGEGCGATFTLTLPLAEAPADDAPVVPAATGAGVHGLRVLVVDDDALLRAGVVAALAHHGAHVTDVGAAEDALAALVRAPFDVLVCDLAMPGTDGYALARALRSRPVAAGGATPAIALSGQARDEDRVRALSAGYQDYVVKPVAPATLLAVVAQIARGQRSRLQSSPAG